MDGTVQAFNNVFAKRYGVCCARKFFFFQFCMRVLNVFPRICVRVWSVPELYAERSDSTVRI